MTDCRTITVNRVALVAGLISLLVFLRAVAGDFVNYDDNRFVIDNPGIRQFDFDMLLAAFTRQFSNDYWAPLTWISFAIDYHFWGLNPAGYHLVNILLHSVNTGLVVLLADRLFRQGDATAAVRRDFEGRGGCRYPLLLLFAGLLWGIHPLRVESVAWVAERKDVLYGMFALCAILKYLRFAEKVRAGEKGRRQYVASLLFFMLALMAKPTSVFVPMLLLLADWYPLRRFGKGEMVKVILEKVPFFLLSALVTLLTVMKMSMTSAPYSYSDFPVVDRVIVSGHAIFDFCRLLLYPVGIHLFNTIAPVLAEPLPAYAKTLVVALFTGYAIHAARRHPAVFAVWLAFLIPLLPTLPFFQVGVDVAYSSRHSYLPAVVPSIALVALCAGAYNRLPAAGYRWLRLLLPLLIVSYLLFHAAMSVYLIGSWKDSETLWSRVIEFNPIGRAYYYRAIHYKDVGRYGEAADDFLLAAERAAEAGNPGAFNYFALGGDAALRAGRYDDAVAAFTTAIGMNPKPNYYYHRGRALQFLGRLNEAAEDFRVAGADRGDIEFQELW